MREQVEGLGKRAAELPGGEEVKQAGKALVDEIQALEGKLVQTRSEGFQDVINFENRLNAELLSLLEAADGSGPPVTAGARARWRDLAAEWFARQAELAQLFGEKVAAFNALVASHAVPAVIVPEPAGDGMN